MNELALFAGAGGGILAGQMLGWRTICAVEWEAYPASVLAARQNDGHLEPFPIWDDVRTFDGTPWRGRVDVVSGGFPCQDISAAGKGAGIDGERSGMWVEMARIIGEVRPAFVFVENSPMLTSRGLGRVLGDLAALGFDAEWGVLGAADVGAPHQRDRIWVLGWNPNSQHVSPKCQIQQWQATESRGAGRGEVIGAGEDTNAHQLRRDRQGQPAQGQQYRTGRTAWGEPASFREDVAHASQLQRNGSNDNAGISMGREQVSEFGDSCGASDLADPASIRQPRPGQHVRPVHQAPHRDWQADRFIHCGKAREGQWLSEPNVGRVANGVASRVDRLKAIGNGQVPQCAAAAFIEGCRRLAL